MNMKHSMNRVAALAAGAWIGFAAPDAAQARKIYFEESFRNYADDAPGVVTNRGFSVDNDPIWSGVGALNARCAQDGPVYEKPLVLPAGGAFDLLFKFRFLNAQPPKGGETPVAGAPGHFDVVFALEGGREQRIQIASDAIGGTPIAFRDNWVWAEVALKFDGKSVAIHFAPDRSFSPLGSIGLKGRPVSVNFVAYAERHFSIRDIEIRDPEPLPDYPVEKHFAAFRSLAQPIAGAKTAKSGESVSLDVAPRGGIRLALGPAKLDEKGQPIKAAEMTAEWSDGTKSVYPLSIFSQAHTLFAEVSGKAKGEKIVLPEAGIAVGGTSAVRQHTRPHLKPFVSSYDIVPQGIDVIREWNRTPPASTHPLDIDFIRNADGSAQWFLDGSYVGTLKPGTKESASKAQLVRVTFTFADGVRYAVKPDGLAGVDTARFTVLDLSANPRAKAFAGASLAGIEPGIKRFGEVPVNVAAPIDSADVAICKEGKGNWALEVEEYLGRSPQDGFPAAIHYRLPAEPYAKAHLLVAVDPDPAKDPVLTVRLGHYVNNGSGGNMLADAVLELKDGKFPESFRQVGTVKHKGRDIPLMQGTVDLPIGRVLDLAARRDYIDFEFLGRRWENFQQIDNSMKPDPSSDSAFNVFGVTLEKAPVLMDVEQSQPGNVFTVDEKNRKTTVKLRARVPGAKGSVSWSATSHAGIEAAKGSRSFTLAKAGDDVRIDIPLDKVGVGHYDLAIVVQDERGVNWYEHPARAAVLPPARRLANKYDSPYNTWWFTAHGSTSDESIGGPIMQKAGIRKAGWISLSKEAQEKYDLTDNLKVQLGTKFDREKGAFIGKTIPDPGDPTKKRKLELSGEETVVQDIRKALDANPRINHVMIWHETAPGYGIPEELLGWEVPGTTDRNRSNAAFLNEAGRIIRKHFPNLLIQVGNSSASIGAVVGPLRGGANPAYYDRIGIETPSQVIPTERLIECGLQGMVVSKEIGEKLGKRPFKLNGCWEFTYRAERDMGEQKQAEWYMRDILVSLANDFFLISPGILFDCSTGYYNGLWGGSGILQRPPYCYPKRAYVAYGVLTSVLDGVKFVRQIPTGSTTVYALEFKRPDGKIATALWTARGEATLAVETASAGTATAMMGETSTFAAGVARIEASTSPVYLLADKPVGAIQIVARGFREDFALAAAAQVGAKLDDAAAVALEPDPALESKHNRFLPILKPSAFAVRQVEDEEKGPCIEVALDTSANPETSKYITEYTTLRLKEPQTIPGNPSVIGVWVKGNSNWGQIRFEIEDAHGEVFKNQSTGSSWGCDIMDWPGNLAVSFDGWGYVYQPLGRNTLVPTHSPGPASDQWVSEGGDKKIDLPIKIRAITVGMNRTKLDLLDFKPSSPAIRIRDVGGITE